MNIIQAENDKLWQKQKEIKWQIIRTKRLMEKVRGEEKKKKL